MPFDDVPGLLALRQSSLITLRGLRFDANGLEGSGFISPGFLDFGVGLVAPPAFDSSRALVFVDSCEHVDILDCEFIDSQPRRPLHARSAIESRSFAEMQRLAVSVDSTVQPIGDHENRDIRIVGNEMTGQGIAVRVARRVRIARNSLYRPKMHGIVLASHDTIVPFTRVGLSDIAVEDNCIIDPQADGIRLASGSRVHRTFVGTAQRVSIRRNTIRKTIDTGLHPEADDLGPGAVHTAALGYGIFAGLAKSHLVDIDASDLRFVALSIERNVIQFTYRNPEELTDGDPNEGIFLAAPRDEPAVRVRFEACRVVGNAVFGSARYGITGRNVRGGVVADNLVGNCRGGILVGGETSFTEVRGNTVQAEVTAYRLLRSNGANFFVRNTVHGETRENLETAGLEPSDVVEDPLGVVPVFRSPEHEEPEPRVTAPE